MNSENNLETVKSILESLLEGDIFLVDMKVKPTNNIKIYLDADTGLGIEKCIKINRALYKVLEEMAIYPDGDFSLEVSSPGIDEPLKLSRQYHKNIGRTLIVKANDETFEAELIEANDEYIVLSWQSREPKKIGKGKETVQKRQEIPYSDIKQAVVTVNFN
jgi:ribosome maturation factor RimP